MAIADLHHKPARPSEPSQRLTEPALAFAGRVFADARMRPSASHTCSRSTRSSSPTAIGGRTRRRSIASPLRRASATTRDYGSSTASRTTC